MISEGALARTLVPRAFGPVKSRRLGVSLGVSVVPMKTCSYSCIYCQLGETTTLSVARANYCTPEQVLDVVGAALDRYGGRVDYITFVGDGEPTLYSMLGKAVLLVEAQGWARTALISNSSLIWRRDVMEDAMVFDFVSLKLDAPTESVFRSINRPHDFLKLSMIVEGIERFSRDFTGFLAIEIMLVKNVNCLAHLSEMFSEILRRVDFDRIYINTPIRPTCVKWVERPALGEIAEFVEGMSRYVSRTKIEVLPFEEGIDEILSSIKSPEQLLEIAKLHPLPLEIAFSRLSAIMGEERARMYLQEVLESGKVRIVEYGGKKFIKTF